MYLITREVFTEFFFSMNFSQLSYEDFLAAQVRIDTFFSDDANKKGGDRISKSTGVA